MLDAIRCAPPPSHGTISCAVGGQTFDVGLTERGHGPLVLMLPGPSSISTRHELAPIQAIISRHAATLAVDWPGFGDLPRRSLDWRPHHFAAFLRERLMALPAPPLATIAAGHAAGYLLQAAAAKPGSAGRLCLLAPTWRGPLPTMLRRRRPILEGLVRAADLSILGGALYRLHVNRPMVRLMAREHVYADAGFIDQRFPEKAAVFRSPGARHAALRFVTGMLDPFPDRDAMLDEARRSGGPIQLIYGEAVPPRSKAEMEALGRLPGVETAVLPFGKLNAHEEFPADVAEPILRFLGLGQTESA